jgi:3-isopropylmalate dehydratase
VAPDDITFSYLKGRPMCPTGEKWDAAVANWKELVSDADCVFDKEISIRAEDIAPTVTWGTSPQDVAPISGSVPDPAKAADPARGTYAIYCTSTETRVLILYICRSHFHGA